MPLIGGSVTSFSRSLGHWISFGVNLVVFTASIVFVFRQSSRRARQPTHWLRYGPTYLTGVAAGLIMADNTRHVLQDQEVWPKGPWPGSSQYREDCAVRQWQKPLANCTNSTECDSGYGCYPGDGMCSTNVESMACLSMIGWICTAMTYSGFAVFFFASFWNANLLGKLAAIRARWRAIRNTADGQGAQAGQVPRCHDAPSVDDADAETSDTV